MERPRGRAAGSELLQDGAHRAQRMASGTQVEEGPAQGMCHAAPTLTPTVLRGGRLAIWGGLHVSARAPERSVPCPQPTQLGVPAEGFILRPSLPSTNSCEGFLSTYWMTEAAGSLEGQENHPYPGHGLLKGVFWGPQPRNALPGTV